MSSTDRVAANTASHVNRQLEEEARARVRTAEHESEAAITGRILALEQEWDVERVLETNAPLVALTGILLSLLVDRRFLLLPVAVLGFLLLHATQGWCPPLPILRRLGIRTRQEIEQEIVALKALRGDFTHSATAGAAWAAASK